MEPGSRFVPCGRQETFNRPEWCNRTADFRAETASRLECGYLEGSWKDSHRLSQSDVDRQWGYEREHNDPPQTRRLLRGRRDGELDRRMRRGRSRDVFLKIYDITQGRAQKYLKPIIPGIDGIWHTSLLCYGREHFYCGGIQSLQPQTVETKFAMSLKDIVYLGRSNWTAAEFQRFLKSQRGRFSPDRYDLTHWNCNHFTEVAIRALFSIGGMDPNLGPQHLPSYIVDQPKQFNSSAWGRILIWMTRNVLEATDNRLNDTFAKGLDRILSVVLGRSAR